MVSGVSAGSAGEPGRDVDEADLTVGLEGDARRDRAALVAWLLERGFSTGQIRSSLAPMLLPANRVMGDDGVYVSAREIAESANVDLEMLQRLQRAVGLPRIDDPDAAVLSRADTEAAARTKYFIDFGLDTEEAVAVIRVLTESLRRVASMMRDTAHKVVFRPGATEVELAQTIEAIAQDGVPPLMPVVEGLLLLELRRMYELEGISAAERAVGELPGARQVAVAFADLAGFTRLGEALPPEQLARLAIQLADLTHDIVDSPVWFIKSIGDAVMLVSSAPTALVSAVLDLIDSAASKGLPQLRAGIAAGAAVSRAGDWFGSAVNVASRVTGLAQPGTLLVAESAKVNIESDAPFTWSSAGAHELKGVAGQVNLFLASRDTGARRDSAGNDASLFR